MTAHLDRDPLADERLWFPGAASVLAAAARAGGGGWLSANLPDPSKPAAEALNEVRIGRHRALVAPPPAALIEEFPDMNLADVCDRDVLSQLQRAADLLDCVATLSDTVGAVVDTVHPLRAPTDHDVSYSTPEMPFAVFVSVPHVGERDATRRVAEAMLHEAMHLQLTLIDQAIPLTLGSNARGYSPWKQEDRPILGLLHGLYVFAVIYQVLGHASHEVDEPARRYRDRRLAAIRAEVASLPPRPSDLSVFGAELWDRCLRAVGSSSGTARPSD